MNEIKSKTFLEDIKDMKEIGEKMKAYRTILERIKKDCYKKLVHKYPEVFDDAGISRFKSWDFDAELSLIFRGALKTTKLVKVRADSLGYPELNLTNEYGLKYPKCWSSFHFLSRLGPSGFIKVSKDYRIDAFRTRQFREWNRIERRDETKSETNLYFSIYLGELKDLKNVKFDRVQKYLYFLKKIIALNRKYYLLEQTKKSEAVQYLKDLSDYSDLEKFERVGKMFPKFQEQYSEYSDLNKALKATQDVLMLEIQNFNKPLKMVLKLKDSE